MKHDYNFDILGIAFEFNLPMLFLLSIRHPFELKLIFQHPEDWENYFVDTELVIFNFEIIGVYIDRYKIHFGFLGFGLNIWFNSQD